MPSTTSPKKYRADSRRERPGRRRLLPAMTAATDGDGGDSSGGARVPQRAYITGMLIALAGILMFFMAFVSAYIVRKGMPNSAWIPLELPRILWLNTLMLIASSFTLRARASRFTAKDRGRIPALVGDHDDARRAFCGGPDHRVAPAGGAGNFPGDESQQQLFLRFHRRARSAFAGRSAGAAVYPVPHASQSGARARRWKSFRCTGILWMGCGFSCFYSSTWEVKRE